MPIAENNGLKRGPYHSKWSAHRFEKKIMLCVFWNYERPVHWELVPDGHIIDGNLYKEQLQRVFESLKVKYSSRVNRDQALLQHDSKAKNRGISRH